MACRVEDFKFIFCGCESVETSPELVFYVQDAPISVSPSNLFENVGDECRFVVTYHKADHWVLGQAFFFEYLLSFEFQAKTIGLLQKPHGEAEEEKPILTYEELWITFFTVGGCFLFYVLVRVTYVVYVWASERFRNNSEDIEEPLVENHDFLEIAKFRARRSEASNRALPIPAAAQINPKSLKVTIMAFLDIDPVPSIEIENGLVLIQANHPDLPRVEHQVMAVLSKLEVDTKACWSYFAKPGYFRAFPEDENNKLEEFYTRHAKVYDPSYISHSQSIQVTAPKPGRVYFDKLGGFHVMIRNRRIIPIKRFAAYESFCCKENQFLWKWFDIITKDHRNYSAEENYYLELAYQKWCINNRLKIRLFSNRGVSYKMNFKKMSQKNLSTNFERGIRRVDLSK